MSKKRKQQINHKIRSNFSKMIIRILKYKIKINFWFSKSKMKKIKQMLNKTTVKNGHFDKTSPTL